MNIYNFLSAIAGSLGRGTYKARIFGVLGLILFFSPYIVLGESSTLLATADGMSTIDGNAAKARERAIEDALTKGVEQAVASLVSAEELGYNEETIRENIYSRYSQYVQNFKVLSERSAGNLYFITLETAVSKSRLRGDLSILGLVSIPARLPPLLIMISERNDVARTEAGWWQPGGTPQPLTETERIVGEIFAASGFEVVARRPEDLSAIKSEYRKTFPEKEALLAFCDQFKAETIINGRIVTRIVESASEPAEAITEVELAALSCQGGDVIASTEKMKSLPIGESQQVARESLFTALNESAGDMVAKLLAHARIVSAKTSTIGITVSGITSYAAYTRFENLIRNSLKGIRELTQKGIGGGKAAIEIKTDLTAQRLADELTMLQYDGFSIDITAITESKIDVLLKPGGTAVP